MNKKILVLEEELRKAMLNSDILKLNELISSDLLFTNHLGSKISKEDDLKAHENKEIKFKSIELTAFEIRQIGTSTVVSCQAEVDGIFDGQEAIGNFRFTRVWSDISGKWKVHAGHVSLIS